MEPFTIFLKIVFLQNALLYLLDSFLQEVFLEEIKRFFTNAYLYNLVKIKLKELKINLCVAIKANKLFR